MFLNAVRTGASQSLNRIWHHHLSSLGFSAAEQRLSLGTTFPLPPSLCKHPFYPLPRTPGPTWVRPEPAYRSLRSRRQQEDESNKGQCDEEGDNGRDCGYGGYVATERVGTNLPTFCLVRADVLLDGSENWYGRPDGNTCPGL